MSSTLGTHSLKARDISVASASSFIIVVSIGFIGLLMVCVGTSSYYRRRAYRQGLLEEIGSLENPRIQPELFDVHIDDLKLCASGHGVDWEQLQVSTRLCRGGAQLPLPH